MQQNGVTLVTMPLFSRRVQPSFSSAPIQAAAGASQVGNFLTYSVGATELRALQNPVISRSRDLIASMIGSLELKQYQKQWTGENYEEVYIPNETWMDRPDPKVTRNFFFANLFSDLFFYGRCFAYVTLRNASDNRPAAFTWLPAASVSTPNQAGPQWFGPAEEIEFNGIMLNPNDVVMGLSPIMGLLYSGSRALTISERLEESAARFAQNEIAAGYLQQKGGEPMSADELGELAAGWANARRTNSIGALNEYVEWKEFGADPSKLQLVEGRQHQDLNLSRIANIPPYLLGISTAGMTYQNAQQARQDLYLFGAKPYIDCLEQTFSMDNVLPRGRYVEFDVESYLLDNSITAPNAQQQEVPAA